MAASASFDPPPVPLDGSAVTIGVALFDRSRPQGKRYRFVPNVRCERIIYRQGAVPPSAQFSYVLDTSDPSSPFPIYAEGLWPLAASGAGVVPVGDELVVFASDENGSVRVLFDGFADAPQIDVAGRSQSVTFTASGVAVRCWDEPIGGAIYRDSTDPQNGVEVPTDLIVRFNPDYKPNCTPDDFDVNEGKDGAYPVFLDWRIARTPDPRTYWTLGKFARYLLNTRPSGTKGDLAFVDNPKSKFLAGLDSDLQALKPTGGPTAAIDTADPSTYVAEDILLDDVIASDRPWPEVLSRTLERHGFAMRFRIGQDGTAPLPEPMNVLHVYRKDGLFEKAPKDLLLQPAGAGLDPGKSNVAELHLVRDARDAANQFRVVSRPSRYEVGVVLAAGFTIAAADATTPDQFKTPALAKATGDMRRKYRVYVADEAGDGHWDLAATPPAMTTSKPLDLSGIFGKPDPPDPNAPAGTPPAPPKYVPRCRPGFDVLFALDDQGKPFRAELAISTDYAGASPTVWDGKAGTWQSLGHVGWRLLRDRLGIEITTDNPNGWKIPDPPAATTPVIPGGVVRGVEAQAAPSATMKRFYLKLTCIIESDWGVDALAEKRSFAPGDFAVERAVDARDVYRDDTVDPSSIHYVTPPVPPGGGPPAPGTGPADHDDTKVALARALAYRSAREFPAVAGRVIIPWVSLAYKVGDRLRTVSGRGIDLRTNAGAGVGESPYYPSVVSVTWDFSGGRQATALELSDHRSEPAPPALPKNHR